MNCLADWVRGQDMDPRAVHRGLLHHLLPAGSDVQDWLGDTEAGR
jgi:hypothetical protein